jgi:hypothetical protein
MMTTKPGVTGPINMGNTGEFGFGDASRKDHLAARPEMKTGSGTSTGGRSAAAATGHH